MGHTGGCPDPVGKTNTTKWTGEGQPTGLMSAVWLNFHELIV
jgi:hypothetical protein